MGGQPPFAVHISLTVNPKSVYWDLAERLLQYYSSSNLHCPNCLSRQSSKGQTRYYHTAITPVIVCPGRSEVIALPPECIMPQDGHDKQDGERVAGKRWIDKHAKQIAPHGVTLLGDDLYSNQPFCACALKHGFNFILTCKPDSPTCGMTTHRLLI
jgi:hypothetical protein